MRTFQSWISITSSDTLSAVHFRCGGPEERMLKRYKLRNYDFKLILLVLAISIIGIMAVGSAKESLQSKQIAGVAMGIVLMIFFID